MMLEHVVLAVTPGREEEFEASARTGVAAPRRRPPAASAESSVAKKRTVRSYLLLIRWESIEAHMAWRETDDFQRWRELTHPFYLERPSGHALPRTARALTRRVDPELGAQHVGHLTERRHSRQRRLHRVQHVLRTRARRR